MSGATGKPAAERHRSVVGRARLIVGGEDRPWLIALAALMVVSSVLEVFGLSAIPMFISSLGGSEGSAPGWLDRFAERHGLDSTRDRAIAGAAILAVALVGKNVLLILTRAVSVLTTERLRVRLTRALFAVYMASPYEERLGRRPSELLRNVKQGVNGTIVGFIQPLMSFTLSALQTVAIAALLLLATPGSALVGVGLTAGAAVAFSRLIRSRLRRAGETARVTQAEVIGRVSEGLDLIPFARLSEREEFFVGRVDQSTTRFARAARTQQFLKGLSGPVLEISVVVGMASIVVVLATTQREKGLEALVPTLALLAAVLVRLRATTTALVTNSTTIRYTLPLVDDVCDGLERRGVGSPETTERPPPMAEPDGRCADLIELCDVSYRYPGSAEPALSHVDLRIRRGSTVAFAGPTGSGKTTAVLVLLGLLEPQEGLVRIDGLPTKGSERLRGRAAYLSQNVRVLDGTIRQNVAIGVPDEAVKTERLWRALEAAQLADYVRELPVGLETLVGEAGARLSGGQRQRLALARALYDSVDLLVLDEGTSALDGVTERAVLAAIERRDPNQTVILVAHGLSVVRRCDRVAFFRGGRLEHFGPYRAVANRERNFFSAEGAPAGPALNEQPDGART